MSAGVSLHDFIVTPHGLFWNARVWRPREILHPLRLRTTGCSTGRTQRPGSCGSIDHDVTIFSKPSTFGARPDHALAQPLPTGPPPRKAPSFSSGLSDDVAVVKASFSECWTSVSCCASFGVRTELIALLGGLQSRWVRQLHPKVPSKGKTLPLSSACRVVPPCPERLMTAV